MFLDGASVTDSHSITRIPNPTQRPTHKRAVLPLVCIYDSFRLVMSDPSCDGCIPRDNRSVRHFERGFGDCFLIVPHYRTTGRSSGLNIVGYRTIPTYTATCDGATDEGCRSLFLMFLPLQPPYRYWPEPLSSNANCATNLDSVMS